MWKLYMRYGWWTFIWPAMAMHDSEAKVLH